MNLKKFTPHIIAVVTFICVTALYFAPMIFGNKQLYQSDIMQATGVSKEIVDFRAKYHEEPYWTNELFGGMPAYQVSAIYASNKLNIVNNILSVFFPHPIRYILICFIGFYFLLQVLRVDPWLSIMGALAFGLSSYFIIFIDAGHNSKVAAISYMAPVLAGMILLYRGRLLTGAALTALFLSLEIYCNHPQITYYLCFIIGFYVLAECINAMREKNIKPFIKQSAIMLGATLLAVGINSTSLWATASFSKYTIRGASELTINPDGSTKEHKASTSGLDRDYATSYSYGLSESLSLLIPDIKGGASAPIGNNKAALKKVREENREAVASMNQYFGDMPITNGPIYIGAIIIFLFVLGIFIPSPAEEKDIRRPLKQALIASTLIAIWLAWGSHDPFHLTDFMLDYFPAYNKFRAVVTILVIATLTIPILAVLAVDAFVKRKDFLKSTFSMPFKKIISGQNILIASFLLTGGIALLCWLSPAMFTEFSAPNEKEMLSYQIKQSNPQVSDAQINTYLDNTLPDVEVARKEIVKADAIRSFFFVLIAAVLLWLFAKGIVNRNVLYVSLIGLVLLDLILVDKRYLNNDSFINKTETKNLFAKLGRPNTADLEILKDTDPNYRVWNTLARLDQDGITSYFHKSLGGYSGAKLRRYQELIDFHINQKNMAVVDMLNTKYFIFTGQKGNIMEYPNPNALGNAWFVTDYKIVENPDSEIMALKNFNPKTTAILDKRFQSEVNELRLHPDTFSVIKLTSYKANDLVYESNSPAEGLAVFSEIYYPEGWNAYIDGKLSPHFRVNYVLRAMRLPAGKHAVEFKFEPTIISTGEKISNTSMALLLLLCGFAAFKEFKQSKTIISRTKD